jgi:hypothetical protein
MTDGATAIVETSMRSLPAVVAILLSLGAGPVLASIRIDDAQYEDGKLTVTGQAEPNQQVTLDRKYSTMADASGHFEFHSAYRPSTCMANLTAGDDSYSAIVTGCLLDDAAAALKQ